MKQNTYADQLEGDLVYFGLEPSNIGGDVVRRVSLSADRVKGVFEYGYAE